MGVVNLLPLLKETMDNVPLTDLQGKTAGVDVSIWIHKVSAYRDTDVVQYVIRTLATLIRHGVTPLPVFDGIEPEAKLEARQKRDEDRLRCSKWPKLKQAVGNEIAIGSHIGKRTKEHEDGIKEWCKLKNISYCQAPCEADSQLAYLMNTNKVDIIITEDTDLIVYGCKKIFFKMALVKENDSWQGKLFEQEKMPECFGKPVNLEVLRAVCILMGSDYFVGGLKGFGFKKAIPFCESLHVPFNFANMESVIKKMFKIKVDAEFKTKFMRAYHTFAHQLVLDPDTEEIVPFSPYQNGATATDFPYAGRLSDGPKANAKFFKAPQMILPEIITQPQSKVTGRGKLFCRQCPEVFENKYQVKKHNYTFHPITCPECKLKFQSNAKLVDHMKVHRNPKPTEKCQLCHKYFWTISNLRDHVRRVHSKQKSKCPNCNKVFKNQTFLNAHIVIHQNEKPFKCEFCNKAFQTQRLLNHHIENASSDIHKKQYLFKCKHCNKAFKTKNLMTDHAARIHEPKQHVCVFCNKGFFKLWLLMAHIGVHLNEIPYKCDICGQGFKMKMALKKHSLDHIND